MAINAQDVAKLGDVVPGADDPKFVKNKQKIEKFIAILSQIDEGQEPMKTGSNPAALPVAIPDLPDRQDISMETMKYVTGVSTLVATLMPLYLIMMSVWQFLGGLGELTASLAKMANAIGPSMHTQALTSLTSALEDQGMTLEDLKDPQKALELGQNLTVPPVSGVSSEPLKLGEFLDRLVPQLPVVAVPGTSNSSSDSSAPPGTMNDSNTMVISAPVKERPELVNPAAEEPPICSLVNTNQFRYDPNPFNVFGDPAAALAADLDLAADMNDIAGQHNNLASAAEDIQEAAEKFKAEEYDKSFCEALHAIMKGLVTYNFQTDATGSITSSTERSLRWWNDYLPPPAIMDPALTQKIANGEALTPAEETAFNNALTLLSQKAVDVVADDRRWGALPGTLVYAALKDSAYSGTLDDLLDDIPQLIAQQEGLSGTNVSLIQDIIFDIVDPDERISDIPTILMGGDPRVAVYGEPILRWATTLKYLKDLTPAQVNSLQTRETQISTATLLFIADVKASSIQFENLYIALLRHTLTYEQRVELNELASFWDQLSNSLVINPSQQDPDIVVFLTELLAAKALLPNNDSMLDAVEQLLEATLTIGGPLGSDLAQMVGVLGGLLRACAILDSNTVSEKDKETRTKTILKLADEMSKPVEHFPNPGLLANIAEAI